MLVTFTSCIDLLIRLLLALIGVLATSSVGFKVNIVVAIVISLVLGCWLVSALGWLSQKNSYIYYHFSNNPIAT